MVLRRLPIEERTVETQLGLVEALSNAVVHGALGVASRREGAEAIRSHIAAIEAAQRAVPHPGRIVVQIDVGAPSVVEISDPGAGFDWARATPQPGHGLSILRAVFDDVTWNAAGNSVRLVMGRSS